MEDQGNFEIAIDGIKPKNLDINDIKELFASAEKLLYPDGRTKRKHFVSYELREGSAKNIFTTLFSTVLSASNLVTDVAAQGNLYGINENQAIAIERIQHWVKKTGHSVTLGAPDINPSGLIISTETNFVRDVDAWYDVDMYLYGTITDMGGQTKPNIHLTTEHGTVIISISHDEVENIENNLIFKRVGISATVKQNVNTNEIKATDAIFKEFVEYEPQFDAEYLNSLIERGTVEWSDVPDPDSWLSNLRGH